MINREQVEAILKINGVAPGSASEEIRSVLLSARYSHDEVDTAIMVLREDTKTNKTRVDGLHKIFRTSEALTPGEISQLLGIEVEINQDQPVLHANEQKVSGMQFMAVWFLSLSIAVGGIFGYMYIVQVGVFHPDIGISITK